MRKPEPRDAWQPPQGSRAHKTVQVSTQGASPKCWLLHATHGLLRRLTSQLLPSSGKKSPKGGLTGRRGSSANLAEMCQPWARASPDTPSVSRRRKSLFLFLSRLVTPHTCNLPGHAQEAGLLPATRAPWLLFPALVFLHPPKHAVGHGPCP